MTQPNTNVLLVDDDRDFVFQQEVALQAAGYNVATAYSAAEARDRLQEHRPDVAVIDLMMEEMDAGFALARHLKQELPEVHVVLVTAVAAETGMRFNKGPQADDGWIKADTVLEKPIRFEQLQAEIEKVRQ